MAVNITQYIAAGFDRCHWWRNDSGGVAAGSAGTVAAGAAGSPSGRLLGIRTADINVPDSVEFTRAGDNQPLGKFLFSATETPGFTMELDAVDQSFIAAIAGLLVQNIGDMSMVPEAAKDLAIVDVGLLFLRDAKSKQSGSDGTSMFEGLLIPQANLYNLGSPFEFQAGGPHRYRVALQSTNVLPYGATLTNALNGTDAAAYERFTFEHRLDVHAYVGDNAQATFVTQYTPAGTTVSKVHVYKDGIRQTSGVTVTQATKTITLSPVPGSGVKTIVAYEYTL